MKTKVRLEMVSFAETIDLFQAFSEKFAKLTEGWRILVTANREKAELIRQADIQQDMPVAVSRKLFSQVIRALNEFARTEEFPYRFRLNTDFLVVVGSNVLTIRVGLRCKKIEDEIQ